MPALPRLGTSQTLAIEYSPFERKVFQLLRRTPKSTVILTDELYGTGERPYHARTSVLGALDNLARKVERNGEPFAIGKTKRMGPHPVAFWIAEEKAAKAKVAR